MLFRIEDTDYVLAQAQAHSNVANAEVNLARAEEEGVEVLEGPLMLLGWIEPAPDGADFTGSRLSDGSAIRFQEDLPADVRMAVAELRADIDRLREHKEAFDRLLEGLPESKLTYADLFGETPRVEVFIDNCHLMPLGAELAGAALAEAVLRVMREEDRESLER